MNTLIFGYGYTGAAFGRRILALGGKVTATVRNAPARSAAEAAGITVIDPSDSHSVATAATNVESILVTAAPDDNGCPGLAALSSALTNTDAHPAWIGYLSSTSVYGDKSGAWTDERSSLDSTSGQGTRRIAAERAWFELGIRLGLTVSAFRLSGIYGPGRSALDRLRQGTARRVTKPGHVTSRIHVDDLVAAIEASLQHPRAGSVYNLSDDEPAPSAEVTKYAASLLGIEPPPLETFDAANVAPPARQFFDECRRVSNKLARDELRWRPAYPSYREGLTAILAARA